MKKFSVVLLTLILAAAWTASAFADATPYASVRFQTFYQDVDNATAADTTDLLFQLYPTNVTRLGVKFKATDEVSGLFELGVNSTGGMILRHAFGTYKTGAGTLLIGQTWAPYAVFFNQVYDDTAALRQGAAANRAQQVVFTFTPGLYVGLLKNAGDTVNGDDIQFPELAVGYKGKAGTVGFGIHGTYLTLDEGTIDDESYAVMADVTVGLGAADLMARAFYGEDVNSLIGGGFALSTGTAMSAAGNDLNSYGVIGTVTFKLSDMASVAVGAAYQETEAVAGDDNNELTVWVNAPIKIAKGFMVVPEIAYQDALDVPGIGGVGANADQALWVGAKWQFDF